MAGLEKKQAAPNPNDIDLYDMPSIARWLEANPDKNAYTVHGDGPLSSGFGIGRQQLQTMVDNDATKTLQHQIIQNQMNEADKYTQNLGSNINSEVDAARRQLQQKLTGAQANVRGNANARGMFQSGRRVKQEGDLLNQAGGELADARGNIVNKAVKTSQDMYARPLGGGINNNVKALQAQQESDAIQNNYNRERAGVISGGAGLIGGGVGSYYGSKS